MRRNPLKRLVVLGFALASIMIAGSQTSSDAQTDPGGKAVSYSNSNEIPESARPNDATISLYEARRRNFIRRRASQNRMYKVDPKGNAVPFEERLTTSSNRIERELSQGFILSYLYYADGFLKYNGTSPNGRFRKDINDETVFFTHSTGKSIVSFIMAHAICEGFVTSIDEIIDWPMMRDTLYQGQVLRDLLDMNAGDQHTVNRRANRVMGAERHHRDMGVDTIAALLKGTERRGSQVFYNNVLSDIIANYIAFRAGPNYDALMRLVFQDKIRIEHPVFYEKHARTLTDGKRSPFYGLPETQASYSFFMTRLDFLRFAVALMKDYQEQTCVGNYLREAQASAKSWYKFAPNEDNSQLWLHRYARKYGAQFYFDFQGMTNRNILATEGFNGQNIMIDMDNGRIVVTNSAATGWDQRTFILDVIKNGQLPD